MTRQKYIQPTFPEAAFILALLVGEISGRFHYTQISVKNVIIILNILELKSPWLKTFP